MQKRNNPAVSKFGLIGCGQIGSLYDEQTSGGEILSVSIAIQACPDTALIAVCDNDFERAQACAKIRGNAKPYADFDKMFAENKLDGVAICTPPNIRFAAIEAALKAGVKIIWCEKPLADSSEQVDKIKNLLALPENKHVVFAVNYLRRWLPSTDKIKHIIETNALGATRSARLTYGKGIANNGSHFIDLMNHFYGQPDGVKVESVINDQREDDPTLNATLSYAHNGQSFPFHMQGTDYRDHNICELDIIFKLGRIKLLDGGDTVEIYKAVPSDLSGYTSLMLDQKTENAASGALTLALSQILAVEQGLEPKLKCGLKNGIDAFEVVEKTMVKSSNLSGTKHV